MSRPQRLEDDALALEVTRLARQERQATAQLVAALAEFDARRLYLPAGCASLFTYCTEVLHLSEHAAYHRIEAARAARRHPDLLSRARHQSKREVEHLVAELRPRADVPASVRKLPAQPHASRPAAATPGAAAAQVPCTSLLGSASTPCSASEPAAVGAAAPHAEPVAIRPDVPVPRAPSPHGDLRSPAPPKPAVIAPLAPERYKVQFTISRETHDRLRRAQDLLRHVLPDGDPAQIFDRALARLVAELERRKLAAVRRPRPGGSEHGRHASGDAPPRETLAAPARSKAQTRHIPAQVRREVWARDAGRCAVVGTAGRCTERGLLEFHHRVPYGDGGETTAANLELRCRLCRYRHNSHYAEWRIMPRSPSATRSAAICSCFYAA